MVSKTVKVVNSQGFHMRPATMFVNEMMKFSQGIPFLCLHIFPMTLPQKTLK